MEAQEKSTSAMHLFHCLMQELILIPPCQCRATWPITAEWYRPGTHTIHMTSQKSTFFYSLQRKLPSKNMQWYLGYQEDDNITTKWKCSSTGHSWWVFCATVKKMCSVCFSQGTVLWRKTEQMCSYFICINPWTLLFDHTVHPIAHC